MEPYDPISRLAACCFGRRPRANGFKTEALRNQYYYSPSMAHIGPGNTTTWPMAHAFGAQAPFALSAPTQAQPYILFTQPMILTNGNPTQVPVVQQAVPLMGAQQTSPLHKVPSMAASQYAIYANSICATTGGAPYATTAIYAQSPQFTRAATIYESPKILSDMARNRTAYLGPIAESLATDVQQHQRSSQPRLRGLNREIYKQLEIIEKQVDLTRDMDLVEKHGLVITRAIEARSLAPHLTDETMRRYQEHFLMSDEYVIRFIEIIKRPGQTLGLYIRLVHFETQQPAEDSREGIVITKIESNSPVYSSQVLHIGDEILSINLIDIRGMSLDDVVTLMSIPKRLVLALRIPRGRDPQLRATYALNQHHHRTIDGGASDVRDTSIELEYARRTGPMIIDQLDQRQRQQQQQQAIASQILEQSASQANLTDRISHQGFGPESMRVSIEPVSTAQQQQRFRGASDGDGEQVKMRPSDFIRAQNNITVSDLNKHLVQPTEDEITHGGNLNTDARNRIVGPPTRLPVAHFEQQIATAQCIEERPSSASDRFRNFSVDNEIASLEREAMNKERHPPLANIDQQMPFNIQISSTDRPTTDTLFVQPHRGPSTLPRRSLPNRPDLSVHNMADRGAPDSVPIRRPMINNIRLGDTSEQSSYFSSSIDAINRELKELRRQRMALGDNDPSLSEETGQNPNPL